ncbi:MAG: ABC transporter permease [Chloroflexota bacterium]
MPSLRLKKIWGDLWANEMRSLMAVLAIAIGLFGVGSLLSAYAILNREIDANFMQTTPASIRLFVAEADQSLADRLTVLPEVGAVELRRSLRPRVRVGDSNWLPFRLFVVDDFSAMQLATFTSESGNWPPATGEILLERSSVNIKNVAFGETIVMQTPNGEPTELTVSGVVHDPGQAPGWQDGIDYGYITMETFALLGEQPAFNEVHVLVAVDPLSEARNNEIALEVREVVEGGGYRITAVTVPTPGKHPHTDQMDSLMFLLQAFAMLVLILSGVLVATIIGALIKQQVRQIGAMKAVGGRVSQIAGIYFGMVLILGTVALLLAIPLGISAGNGIANFIATLLNFNITDNTIPLWVFVVQIVVGLTVPLLAAAIPVLSGSRVTVREAIRDYNVGNVEFGTGWADRLTMRAKGVNRPILLAIRNTFRRRTRLGLIVAILAIGGATFMSAINVNQSWLNTIAIAFDQRQYDFRLELTQPYPVEVVEEALLSVPEITAVESWNNALVVEELPNGADGLRFNLSVVPAETEMIDFPPIEGRWLRPDDTNAIVINHEMYYDDHIDIEPGDTVTLRINGQPEAWEVVGVVREIGAPRRGLGIPASAYVNLDYFNKLTGRTGTTTSVRIQTTERDLAFLDGMQPEIDEALATAGVRVKDLQASSTRRFILENHLVVIIAFLMMMAILIAVVGALALASMISINVLERAREIGMMRSVGASSAAVLQVVLAEGLVIGLLSFVAASLLARPLSVLLGNTAGWIFIRANLDSVFAVPTMLIWLALIIIISLVASFYPAWNATRLSVREVLAYE